MYGGEKRLYSVARAGGGIETTQTEVLIVGAGPVGLLLGNLLGSFGIQTLILEKKDRTARTSRAIGITPPSLEILSRLGLDDTFIREGVGIENVTVHGKRKVLGRVTFTDIPSPYRFILSLPQRRTEEILKDSLKRYAGVELFMNSLCTKVLGDRNGVTAYADVPGKGARMIRASYLCACDGAESTVRKDLGVSMKGRRYPETFLMGDFSDRTGLKKEAHLFFTPGGSVESFPLPERKRRWIIQTKSYTENPPKGFLEGEIASRSGYELRAQDKEWESPFHINNYSAASFYSGRALFLGDAAHIISPIGGQGMNTGFADAELAASILTEMLGGEYDPGLLERYDRCRRRAAGAAARRAIVSMKVGTVTGRAGSALRNGILKGFLAGPGAGRLSEHYAMLTIPCGPAFSRR